MENLQRALLVRLVKNKTLQAKAPFNANFSRSVFIGFQLLIKTFNVNINWLLTGTGSMFMSETEQFNGPRAEIERIVLETLKQHGIIQ